MSAKIKTYSLRQLGNFIAEQLDERKVEMGQPSTHPQFKCGCLLVHFLRERFPECLIEANWADAHVNSNKIHVHAQFGDVASEVVRKIAAANPKNYKKLKSIFKRLTKNK